MRMPQPARLRVTRSVGVDAARRQRRLGTLPRNVLPAHVTDRRVASRRVQARVCLAAVNRRGISARGRTRERRKSRSCTRARVIHIDARSRTLTRLRPRRIHFHLPSGPLSLSQCKEQEAKSRGTSETRRMDEEGWKQRAWPRNGGGRSGTPLRPSRVIQ